MTATNMMEVRMRFRLAEDKAFRELPLANRRELRREYMSRRRKNWGEACKAFAERENIAFQDEEEDDDGNQSDHPILDFIQRLIDSGKIQAFLKFMVTEFLPALFKLIVEFISALAVI